MKFFATLFLSIFCCTAFSQHIYSTKYNNCITRHFLLESEIKATTNLDTLLSVLLKNMDDKKLKKLRGMIDLQILVDSTGRACCLSIENNSNVALKKLNLSETINFKTIWSFPLSNIEAKMVSVTIRLEIYNDLILLFRRGYNGNTGWKILEKTSIER